MKINFSISLTYGLLLISCAALSQNTTQLIKVGSVPKILKETSGLEITSPNSIWSHNDDTYSFLYNIDSTGKLIRAVYINHKNSGWEDLAKDKNNNIYIGGFGNNTNTKKDLRIYKISNPDSITERITNAEVISFNYSDQKHFPPPAEEMNFDADALISFEESLYVFSKNRTVPFNGYTKVYKLPNSPGKYIAELVDSIFLCNESMLNCWVTAADISPDNKHLVLLSHDKIWLISCFADGPFSSGRIIEIPLNHFSHKAAICFIKDHEVFITDELEFGLLGGNLYRMDLNQWVEISCNQN
ncbi:MAG: hypothetical protein RH948_02935 [Cyclobacteriaceae bacterium]